MTTQPRIYGKRLFLDMDGTITESRQKISSEMKNLLQGKCVVVVSGASLEQMRKQLDGLDCHILAQNGNHAWSGKDVWKNELTWKEKAEILAHTLKLVPEQRKDMVEDRGCQISLSLIGHHADIGKKKRFDPSAEKRRKLLRDIPFDSKGLEVKIGGTTCLDYFKKKSHKGTNCVRFAKHMDWNLNDCVYVGDALYEGGNDECVKGHMKTITVKNPKETYAKISQETLRA